MTFLQKLKKLPIKYPKDYLNENCSFYGRMYNNIFIILSLTMEKEKYNRERDFNKNVYGNRTISFYKVVETMLYSACCNPKLNNPQSISVF